MLVKAWLSTFYQPRQRILIQIGLIHPAIAFGKRWRNGGVIEIEVGIEHTMGENMLHALRPKFIDGSHLRSIQEHWPHRPCQMSPAPR